MVSGNQRIYKTFKIKAMIEIPTSNLQVGFAKKRLENVLHYLQRCISPDQFNAPSWDRANDECSTLGMNLVSFGTQEEMEFVQMLLSEFDTQTNNISLKHTSYQDAGNFDPISYMYIGK